MVLKNGVLKHPIGEVPNSQIQRHKKATASPLKWHWVVFDSLVWEKCPLVTNDNEEPCGQ